MTSSGKKRGVAVAATTALALSGLALTTTPAQADDIQGNDGNAVELYTPLDGLSGQTAGGKTTTTLSASSGDTDVNSFEFYWSTDATPDNGNDTLIADVANINGWGTTQWTLPTNPALGTINMVYVEAHDNTLNPPLSTDQSDPINDPANASDHNAVNIDGDYLEPLGVYQPDDTAILTGMSSDNDELDVDFDIAGPVSDEAAGTTMTAGPTTAAGTPFAAIVAVGGNDTGDAYDEVVGRMDDPTESSDAQVFSLYDQVVQPVTKATEPGFDANVAGFPLNEEAHWILSAVDQNGNPVGGVDIYESNAAGGNLFAGQGMGRTLANGNFDDAETDALGQVTIRLNEAGAIYGIDGTEDQNPAPGIGSTYVVVDKDEDGFFDNGSDQIIQLDITNIPQAPATIEVVSSLGDVMDDDESTNITAIVKDANGDTIQDATVNLTEVKDNLSDPSLNENNNLGNDDTDTDGVADWPGTQTPGINGDQVNTTYTATSGAAVGSLTIETDEAAPVWDSGLTAQALANTETTEFGRLELPSGSPLPNRHVEIDLFQTLDRDDSDGDGDGTDDDDGDGPGDDGNAILSPQVEQPAGTIRGSDTFADATTDADGRFGVKIDDPAAPVGQELNDLLSADTTFTGPDDLDLDWLRSLTPARVEILNSIVGGTTADGLQPVLLPGALMPGNLGVGQVTVFNSDDTALDNVSVNLTINEGNFVDLLDPFEPTPAIGAPVDFSSVGQNITVTTGDQLAEDVGIDTAALILANIERNTGFDDDGLVEDEINASAGAASDEHDMTWTTRAVPLNPRATDPLVVELSANQESSILPKARAGHLAGVGQEVDYDVSTWDQFGNPTRQLIDVDDSNPISNVTGGIQSDFALFQPAVSANSPAATNQSLEVELEGPFTTTYFDDVSDSQFDPANPLADIQQLPVVVEQNTAAINWYDVNYGASMFTLGQQGPETVPVGTAVTEVLTATDQEGQRLENLPVDFLRGGPGSEDDDSCLESSLDLCQATDGNGQAFYDFVGGSVGTATVSAVVYEPVVDGGTRIGTIGPDTVRFGQLAKINVKLSGKNAKNNKDKLKVNAESIAAGAKVRLQKKVDGVWKKVGTTKNLNAFGNKVFRVKDRNGNKVTKYRAKVSKTTTTRFAKSNVVKQK